MVCSTSRLHVALARGNHMVVYYQVQFIPVPYISTCSRVTYKDCTIWKQLRDAAHQLVAFNPRPRLRPDLVHRRIIGVPNMQRAVLVIPRAERSVRVERRALRIPLDEVRVGDPWTAKRD
jgi:hypothetical protein